MTSNYTTEFVNDDTVKCFVYSTAGQNDNVFWQQMCEMINKTIEDLTADYIWHRDEFRFNIPLGDSFNDDIPPHLTSTTCFGDNIEDEWLIVYLALEISRQFKDIILQIVDSDGDFLLIEAADYLPPWANPDTTENRVFIFNNHFHFITKNTQSRLGIKEALNFIITEPDSSKVSSEIQGAILNRISRYPDKIQDNLHTTVVKLPIDIATLLTLKPSLISSIVTTYCNHDVIDAKSCKNVNYTDCINVKVKFTKFQYAMLTHSKLMKFMKHIKINENDKKSLIGFKLTCGYQIIMNKSCDDLFSSKEFHKYLSNLKGNGYFQDNIEGSQNYVRLLEKAKDYFMNMECPINLYVSNYITKLMQSDNFSKIMDTLKNKTEVDFTEDADDSWLTINPEQLNEMLDKQYGKKDVFVKDDIITPQTVTSKLSNFLKQASDFEGIEKAEEETDKALNFDADDFVNSVEKILNSLSCSGNGESSDSEFDEDRDISHEPPTDVEKEIVHRLINNDEGKDDTIIENIIKSIKEEEGSTGPSSNLLNTIGINKTDLLDSDDDD